VWTTYKRWRTTACELKKACNKSFRL